MIDQQSGRFAIIPARAIDDRRLGSAALTILCALGTYSDRQGWCWPSLATLARRLGTTKQAVSKQISALARLGYLTVESRRRPDGATGVNLYRLVFDADLEAAHDRVADLLQPEAPSQPQVDHPSTAGLRPSTLEVDHPSTSEVDPLYIEERPNRTPHTPSPAAIDDAAGQFEIFWRNYPSRSPHANPKQPALKKFLAALKKGIPAETIIRGARNYAAAVAAAGTEPKFVAQAATWLAQERWNDYRSAPAASADGFRQLGI